MYTPYCNVAKKNDDGPQLEKQDTKSSPCGAIKWGDDMDYFPMDQQEWSLSSRLDVKLKTMFNPKDWGIQYDLGSFYTNSHLDEWCVNNLNDEWFVSSIEEDLEKNDQQKFIDELWSALDAKDGINEEAKFKIAESLSCKWNRKNSPNSCWNEQMMTGVIETCSDRDIKDGSTLTLHDLLSFEGVDVNLCLQTIRRQMYDESFLFGEDVNLRLCNGEFDYQCPDYTAELGYILSVDDRIISVSLNQDGLQQNAYFAYYLLSVILMAVIALVHFYRRSRNEKETIVTVDEHTNYSTF